MVDTFNDFIRKRLKAIDLPQVGFEKAMGYKDNYFRDVLKGKKGPPLQDLARMAEILKFTPTERRTLRDLALKAHGYDDLAKELRDLHTKVDQLTARMDRLEKNG